MLNNTFKQDLSIGNLIEKHVLLNIQKKYPKSFLMEGYCKEYDIWIPEKNIGIEVKFDAKSNFTGNIVVEIEMFNKPSALITTKADSWIFYDKHKFVSIKVIDIYNCIIQNKYQYTTFIGKGDTQPKKAFLIKKELLYSYGKELGWGNPPIKWRKAHHEPYMSSKQDV